MPVMFRSYYKVLMLLVFLSKKGQLYNVNAQLTSILIQILAWLFAVIQYHVQ